MSLGSFGLWVPHFPSLWSLSVALMVFFSLVSSWWVVLGVMVGSCCVGTLLRYMGVWLSSCVLVGVFGEVVGGAVVGECS